MSSDDGWAELFQAAFDRSLNPMELLNVSRRRVDVNDAMCRLVARPADELLGTLLEEILVPQERAAVAAWWSAFLETGERMGTWTVLCPDDRRISCPYAGVTREVDGRRALFVWLTVATSGDGEIACGERGVLTERERQVVNLVAGGLNTSQIAEKLFVAPATVKSHVENAMGKVGAKTRAQLVAIVMATERILDRV